MVNIVYHDALLAGGVVFERVGQPSKFSAEKHLFCMLFQQIIQCAF